MHWNLEVSELYYALHTLHFPVTDKKSIRKKCACMCESQNDSEPFKHSIRALTNEFQNTNK